MGLLFCGSTASHDPAPSPLRTQTLGPMLQGYSARDIRIVSPQVSVAKKAFGTCSNGFLV
jgi:hypothetical protein